MPFTLAHPAAALLFRGTPLPLTAIVTGAMTPDIPVFFDAYGRPYDLTHSATGVVTVDLLAALLAVLVWFAVLRDPLVDLLPTPVRERLEPSAHYSRTQWLLAVPAAAAGSATHVVWDLFTHRDDGVVEWAQYASSVVGLVLCAAWIAVSLHSHERRPHPRIDPVLDHRALVTTGLVTAAAGLTAGLTAPGPGLGWFLSQTAVVGTITGAVCLVVIAVVWQVRRHAPSH